jgi:hypothetical protein
VSLSWLTVDKLTSRDDGDGRLSNINDSGRNVNTFIGIVIDHSTCDFVITRLVVCESKVGRGQSSHGAAAAWANKDSNGSWVLSSHIGVPASNCA